jgi:methionyl-tRNA synthetase
MSSNNKKFYITTAIDYVNAFPHLGHALEKIQADVLARYHRLLGEEVLFLTGTDENSLKNVQAAKKEKIPVEKLVERNSKKFFELKNALNLSFDDFIRTTEERHKKGVQKLWLACQKDIYKKNYKGLYCVGCEEFYKEKELIKGCCPEHGTKPELIEEENYFFKLSKYQDQLKTIIEKDELKIIPETRKNEVLSFIESGLEDICISRSSERAQGWGIDVPGDPSQKVWVWFDALSNYINAVGYADDEKKFKKWWPADLHVIGKGILRFHAVYWPAILLSAGIKLPQKIFIHGYVTSEGQKMSKSLDNVIDPFELVEKYGVDTVRYFLLREIPSAEDGDFTYEKFEKRYNSDLANGIGNLLSRTLTMAENYWGGIIPKTIPSDAETLSLGKIIEVGYVGNFQEAINEEFDKSFKGIANFSFNNSLFEAITAIFICDGYIEQHKLYKPSEFTGKKEKRDVILYNTLEGIRHIGWILLPFLPDTADKIFIQLGLDPKKEREKDYEEAIKWGALKLGNKIKKGSPLFPKIK